jgi:hypothetical protein
MLGGLFIAHYLVVAFSILEFLVLIYFVFLGRIIPLILSPLADANSGQMLGGLFIIHEFWVALIACNSWFKIPESILINSYLTFDFGELGCSI